MFKWFALLIPVAGIAVVFGITQAQSTSLKVQPTLTVGSRANVPVDPALDEALKLNGVNFSSTTPRTVPRVSAVRALELGNRAAHLTRKPIKSTVEYVLFTDPGQKIKDKPGWKVTYWGAPVVLNGPGPGPDGKPRKFEQPSSKRAVTYVLIDPNSNKNDFLALYSAGPVRD